MVKKIKTATDINGNLTVDDVTAYDISAHDVVVNGSVITGSHPLGDDAEVVNVIFGVDETPPDPTDSPNGTIYIQYVD